jgi:4-amino-4-deoxy-L-arabinose transferase-like glycosyltransferase
VAGSLLAPVVYLMGRTLWPPQRRWSVFAAGLIVINAALVYQSSSIDSSAIYTLLATLALLCGALALDRRRVSWMALAGVLCGLSYLTRSHALLLPVSIGLITLIGLRREPKTLIKLIGVLALGFAVFLVPWWLRNLAVFGVTQPVPLTTIIASRGYEDWFNYTNQPTLTSIAQLGWGTFLVYRVDALLKALGVILVMTFPVGLIGLPIGLFRPERIFRLLVMYCMALYLGVSVVLPSAAVTGSFYHSAGPFVVWAALGGVVALKVLFERPKWRLMGAALAMLLIGLGVGQVWLAGSNAIAQSRVEGQQFAEVTHWILKNIPRGEPLMTTQANTLNYTTGYPALALPTIQSVDVVRQLADRYDVRYVVVTERNGLYPMALDDPAARARLLVKLDETLIYELER